MKYIFVSGGVISGLGKGITTASIAKLLQSRGFIVSPVKIDMYLNIDAGTIRPQEHGEVFVTDDGIETDQDLGHYERFLDINLSKSNYITTGQVYQEVIQRERNFYYDGEDVEAIPHVTDEILRRIKQAGEDKKADIIIIELGGTVGEYQNALFFEAARILKLKYPNDVLHVHVGYLPTPASLGEMKSKPVQQSVRTLNSMGIQPDFIIGRAEKDIDEKRKQRIALFCNVSEDNVISNPDIEPIYAVPIIFENQDLSEKILRKLNLKPKKKNLKDWNNLIKHINKSNKKCEIAIVGKYAAIGDYTLSDAYISVVEALKHSAWQNGMTPKIKWLDSEKIEKQGISELKKVNGLVVPGGFGKRGIEGKIKAIQYARENKIPFLGLCFGLQMAVIEFARNVCDLKGANSTEINPKTKYPVIDIMPEQKKNIKEKNYGATMRLGLYPCYLLPKSKAALAYYPLSPLSPKTYHLKPIYERHRHRYEVNPKYHQILQKNGLVFSGLSKDGRLVEIIELKNHPFFLATQFHPEFKSRPNKPHPLFLGFIKACGRKS
jgi:CTP synthase